MHPSHRLRLIRGKARSITKCLLVGLLAITALITTALYRRTLVSGGRTPVLHQLHTFNVEFNSFGGNDDLPVIRSGDGGAITDQENIKTILMWNDAYGSREYDIGPMLRRT
jgi:hypothetical protein